MICSSGFFRLSHQFLVAHALPENTPREGSEPAPGGRISAQPTGQPLPVCRSSAPRPDSMPSPTPRPLLRRTPTRHAATTCIQRALRNLPVSISRKRKRHASRLCHSPSFLDDIKCADASTRARPASSPFCTFCWPHRVSLHEASQTSLCRGQRFRLASGTRTTPLTRDGRLSFRPWKKAMPCAKPHNGNGFQRAAGDGTWRPGRGDATIRGFGRTAE